MHFDTGRTKTNQGPEKGKYEAKKQPDLFVSRVLHQVFVIFTSTIVILFSVKWPVLVQLSVGTLLSWSWIEANSVRLPDICVAWEFTVSTNRIVWIVAVVVDCGLVACFLKWIILQLVASIIVVVIATSVVITGSGYACALFWHRIWSNHCWRWDFTGLRLLTTTRCRWRSGWLRTWTLYSDRKRVISRWGHSITICESVISQS